MHRVLEAAVGADVLAVWALGVLLVVVCAHREVWGVWDEDVRLSVWVYEGDKGWLRRRVYMLVRLCLCRGGIVQTVKRET